MAFGLCQALPGAPKQSSVREAAQTHSRHLLATLTPPPRHDRACRGSRNARACACGALRRFAALLTCCACGADLPGPGLRACGRAGPHVDCLCAPARLAALAAAALVRLALVPHAPAKVRPSRARQLLWPAAKGVACSARSTHPGRVVACLAARALRCRLTRRAPGAQSLRRGGSRCSGGRSKGAIDKARLDSATQGLRAFCRPFARRATLQYTRAVVTHHSIARASARERKRPP